MQGPLVILAPGAAARRSCDKMGTAERQHGVDIPAEDCGWVPQRHHLLHYVDLCSMALSMDIPYEYDGNVYVSYLGRWMCTVVK